MGNLKVDIIPCLSDNYSYIVSDGNQALVIDPSESKPIINFLEKNNLELKFVLNTHHHFDHVGGNLELKNKYNILIAGNANDKERIPGIDILLNENEKLNFNMNSIEIINVPGHTSECIAFYIKNENIIFTGDSIFSLGCGRLFEGSPQQMWNSICKIKRLPNNTKIYCGHEYTMSNAKFIQSINNNTQIKLKINEIEDLRAKDIPTIPTTVGDEKELNIFFQADQDNIKSLLSKDFLTDEEAFKIMRSAKDVF